MAHRIVRQLRLIQPSCSLLLDTRNDARPPLWKANQQQICKNQYEHKNNEQKSSQRPGIFKYALLSAMFINHGDNGPDHTFESWESENEAPLEVPVAIPVPAIGGYAAAYLAAHGVLPPPPPPPPPEPADGHAAAVDDGEWVDIDGPPNNVEQNPEQQLQHLNAVIAQLHPNAIAQLLANALVLVDQEQPIADDVSEGIHSVGDVDVEELDEIIVDDQPMVIEQPPPDDEHQWPFGFEMDYIRSPGNIALIAIQPEEDGFCHRFRKVNNDGSQRDGFDIVRCRNCRLEYDHAIKRGDVNPGSVNSWQYGVINEHLNQYFFVENPFERHNHHCLANPADWGQHAGQWLIGKGLREFQIHPFGTAFGGWNRTFQAAPRLIHERFPLAKTHHWGRALNPFHTCKTPWYDAKALVNPPFDWNNIPDCYRLTNMGQTPNEMMGEEFVRFVDAENKVLVMCSDSGARALYNSRIWSVDGTFKCVRKIVGVEQLFVWTGLHRESNEYRVGAMALMSKVDAPAYEVVYNVVKQCIRGATGVAAGQEAENIQYMMSDWEKPISIAAKNCFPNMLKKFCCFHFGQSLIRAVKRFHLLSAYQGGDFEVRKYIHACLGTMMMPQMYMARWANTLRNPPAHIDPAIHQRLEQMANYMWTEYLNSDEKLARLDAFSTQLNHPRTSNVNEGWNNGAYKSMRLANATMSTLMSGLVQMDFSAFIRDIHLNEGMAPKRRRTKYVRLDERIQAQKDLIIPILAQLDGAELDERLHRWARYCARMLGSAVHKKLIGGQPIEVEQIPDVVNEQGEVIDVGNDMNNDNFLAAIIANNDVPLNEDVNGNVPGQDAAPQQQFAPFFFDNDDDLEAEVELDDEEVGLDAMNMFFVPVFDDDEDV